MTGTRLYRTPTGIELVVAQEIESVVDFGLEKLALQLRSRPDSIIGLATGSSPLPIYHAMNAAGWALPRTRAFALDEYVGLPLDNPQSFSSFIDREVVGPLKMDPALVSVPNGMASDLAGEAHDFERKIAQAGGVDVQILGIGTNGHLAFNEPGSALESRTRVAALSERTRQDNARFFGDIDDVPTHCLTQGIATILGSRQLLLIASGETKARALLDALFGKVDPVMPASALQMHENVTVLVDTAAARLLPLQKLEGTTLRSSSDLAGSGLG